jgi:integrase/recombinase XerD
VVHLFYKYAVVDEITDRDPTENVTRPKVHAGEQKHTWLPTLDSVAVLDAAIKAGPREHVFVVVLGQMALRVGEMCALNTDSVRHNQRWRTIVFRDKGGDTFERVVPVQALRDLDQLIDGCTDTPLIRNTRGDRMDRAAADRLLHRLTRVAGITRPITPHGLRRSVATNMLAQGLPLGDVQLQLRHVDPRMAMRDDKGKNSLDRAAVRVICSRGGGRAPGWNRAGTIQDLGEGSSFHDRITSQKHTRRSAPARRQSVRPLSAGFRR